MLTFILYMIFWFILSSILLLMNFIVSFKTYKNREKMSPFECGFDPLSTNRIPFSIQFFMISLIFLIFDVEIALLIPLTFMFFNLNKIMIFSSILFMLILFFGLMIEYLEQSIDWLSI